MLAATRQQRSAGNPNYSWSAITLPSVEYWTGVAYGNGRFGIVSGSYIAGQRKVASYSTDRGQTWSTPVEILPASSPALIYDLAFTNGLFMAVGKLGPSSYAVWTSPDMVAWTQRSCPVNAERVFGVNNRFFLIQDGGGASTANGISYNTFSIPGLNKNYANVCFGNGYYFVTNGYQKSTSADGASWTPLTNFASQMYYGASAFGNGVFMVGTGGGPNTAFYRSYDGVNFSAVSSGQNFSNNSATLFTGSKFVFLSHGGAGHSLVSPDGNQYVQSQLYPITTPSWASSAAGRATYGDGCVMVLNVNPFPQVARPAAGDSTIGVVIGYN